MPHNELDWNRMMMEVRDFGTGSVAGTINVLHEEDLSPVARKVYLLSESALKVRAMAWSDAADGGYVFRPVDITEKYTVIAYDYEHKYRAVIADNLQPEPMP